MLYLLILFIAMCWGDEVTHSFLLTEENYEYNERTKELRIEGIGKMCDCS